MLLTFNPKIYELPYHYLICYRNYFTFLLKYLSRKNLPAAAK